MTNGIEMIDKTGGMPTGDDAEEALTVVARYILSITTLPPELAVQMPNIHRCLVAFLAISRMKEAKDEHGEAKVKKH
jgi:hypothetical protein